MSEQLGADKLSPCRSMLFEFRSLGLAYDRFESDAWTDRTPDVIDEAGRRAANELLGAGVPAVALFIKDLIHPRERYRQR